MVKVVWTDEAKKDFDELDSHIQRRIKLKLAWFENNQPVISPKPLHYGLRGLYKFRVGDYRIAYSIHGSIIAIEMVRHRRDIYR